jgi:cyclopropane-fatty-acyl-phospholipid synthase
VAVVEEDYRRFAGPGSSGFDALVSIEMVEAVGAAFLPGYFDACAGLVKPGGRFLMQAIVIVDEHYEQAVGHVDFIKKYIFPGSFMPCRGVLRREAVRAGFEVEDVFEMGMDYAETLAEWRRRFRERIGEVQALGFGEEFVRMWEWYLCYCEAGFREGHLGVVQMTMRRTHR